MRKGVMVLAAMALLAGCAAPMANAPQEGGSAVYVLEAVDGVALPYLEGAGSSVARREVTEGLLQLRADGTFYMDFCYSMNTPTGERRGTRVHQGTWTRAADGIRFEFDNGTSDMATVDGDALFVVLDGQTYRFIR